MNRFHDEPVGFQGMGHASTYLTFHGSGDELTALADLIGASAPVLTSMGPIECEPQYGCFHLHIVVLGDFGQSDLDALISGLRQTVARLNAHLN